MIELGCFVGLSLTMTYFHESGSHYHRRVPVSRSCSGWEGVGPEGYCRQTETGCIPNVLFGDLEEGFVVIAFIVLRVYQGYRIKPHGQLVSVSLTHYCASTPDLSTSWSSTTLKGVLDSGKSHLEASFTLRCFQRLSLPFIATRRYDWRHNRYTRGMSTPVLSY